jgi:uncharacterized iron-regulated membrane protein
MRQLHRWFGLITGIFFAFVALTGIGMQTVALLNPREEGPPPAASPGKAAEASRATDREPTAGRGERKPDFYHWLDHIHDGEIAGPAGRIVSLLLGVALFFFSVSGIWMYWKMYSGRRRLGKHDVFW